MDLINIIFKNKSQNVESNFTSLQTCVRYHNESKLF